MKCFSPLWLYRSTVAGTFACAFAAGTLMADEPPVVKKSQFAIVVNDDGDTKVAKAEEAQQDDADAPKAWLGIELKEVSGDLAKFLGSGDGILVSDIFPDSPAAKADLHQGDVLISANGKQLTGPKALLDVLKALPQPKKDAASDPVKIVLLRKGKEISVAVTPGERPKEMVAKTIRATEVENADDDVATIIGDLKDKSAAEIREWVEKRATGKDGATFFRFGAPSAMWFNDGQGARIEGNINAVIVNDDGEKKIEITVERKVDEPVKIKVKEGDETKEYTGKQIGELSEKIQQLVRPMLQGGNRFQFRVNPVGSGPSGKSEESGDKKETGNSDKKSSENRTERRNRITVFDTDAEIPKWFNEREMAEHFHKMADEWSKKSKDAAKWAQDAAGMPSELKELREQVEKLRDELQSLRAQLTESKKGDGAN